MLSPRQIMRIALEAHRGLWISVSRAENREKEFRAKLMVDLRNNSRFNMYMITKCTNAKL